MKFKKLIIQEGLYRKEIEFHPKTTLIHSDRNSCGKTTLIRALLYSLGYPIPNPQRMKFETCQFTLELERADDQKTITLLRNSLDSLEAIFPGERRTYILPRDHNGLIGELFNANEDSLINNLLGVFYFDQEKGWTLLNRGKVIGSISFNIDDFLRGLSGIDCKKEIELLEKTDSELNKYKSIFSISEYQKEIASKSGMLEGNSYLDELNVRLAELQIEDKQLRNELKNIDKTIDNNKNFVSYVEDMKLVIQLPDGTLYPIKSRDIVGNADTLEILTAKRKKILSKIKKADQEIESVRKEMKGEKQQIQLLKSEDFLEAFDKGVKKLPLNEEYIIDKIKELKIRKRQLKRTIQVKSRSNTNIVERIHTNILKYMTELGVKSDKAESINYVFTNNLQELSGAILHKTVFAFKLAYILELQRKTGVHIPIVLDSPSGKEVDKDNVRNMIKILARDFSENQIIIASIFRYDIEEKQTVELVNSLMDSSSPC